VILLGVMLIAVRDRRAPALGFAAPDRTSQLQQAEPVSNETCLACHSNPSLEKKLFNGEMWSMYVNPDDHANSVHGEEGLNCVQCHTNFDQQHVENRCNSPASTPSIGAMPA